MSAHRCPWDRFSALSTAIPRETVVKTESAAPIGFIEQQASICLKLGKAIYFKNPCHAAIIDEGRHPPAFVILETEARADELNSSKLTARQCRQDAAALANPSIVSDPYPLYASLAEKIVPVSRRINSSFHSLTLQTETHAFSMCQIDLTSIALTARNTSPSEAEPILVSDDK